VEKHSRDQHTIAKAVSPTMVFEDKYYFITHMSEPHHYFIYSEQSNLDGPLYLKPQLPVDFKINTFVELTRTSTI
jgi:hypothetical protein